MAEDRRIKAKILESEREYADEAAHWRSEFEKIAKSREKEMADFKAKVAKAAMEAAEEHSWCEVVIETLNEVGIDVRSEAKLSVTITFDMEHDFEDKNEFSELDSSDIIAHLHDRDFRIELLDFQRVAVRTDAGGHPGPLDAEVEITVKEWIR